MYNNKPRWWQLYLLFPLLVLALFLVAQSGWNTTAKSLADIAAIFFTFGAMLGWMHANDGTIERAEYEEFNRAQAKSFWKVRGWRSKPFPTAKPDPLEEKLPVSGFGSARNKPISTYAQERVTADRVRLHRRTTEKA